MRQTFLIFIFILFYVFDEFRIPQIYEEFYHTINNADREKDLKWWSNNHGINMMMNWPMFEVIELMYSLLHSDDT